MRDQDTQIFRGNGQSGAPTGILNWPNVTTTSLSAVTPTYNNLNDGIFAVEQLNASANVPLGQATCTGIVSAVRLKKQILEMKDSNNRPLWEFSASNVRGKLPSEGGGVFDGWLGVDTWALSNIIPTTTTVGGGSSSSEIYYGDFAHAIVMQRSDIEFASTQVAGTAFQSDQTWLRVLRRYDFGLAHPEAFFVHTGVGA